MQAVVEDHADLMDNVYRGQRHIYDLTRKYYLLGRDRLIAEMNVPDGGTVLEIGCGTGRNLAMIGKVWPDCRLFGLDISDEMLKSAAGNLGRVLMDGRASLAQGDAANFDAMDIFGRARFDRIVFSYTLSMIPDWQGALRQALPLLSTQGSIHIVDFGMQEAMPRWFRTILLAWLRQFHVAPRIGLAEYAGQLAIEAHKPCGTSRLYRDYTQMIVIG
ncbi:MAG: class I SAM-dependent methyltransferase [Sphingorhabdus sp.]